MQPKGAYQVPPTTRIGHVHLKVSNLERSVEFYRDVLGFEIQQTYGKQAVFLSAGGYHHHIGLNTWESEGGEPAPRRAPGLYHAAILFARREELAQALKRLIEFNYPITGAADHGVSHAIYLNDPDGNGIELYWDLPKEQWPRDKKGGLKMITERLDLDELLGTEG